ncbi:unnamed protein product [Hapterophycus canaliculatus]
MSNLRSAYPQAQAWTFLIDTPPPASEKKNTAATAAASGRAGATTAAAAAGAAAPPGASGRIRPALAAGVKVRPNKGSSLSSHHSSGGGGGSGRNEAGGTEEMGAMCSKPINKDTVANKENMGETPEETPPNGNDHDTMAAGGNGGAGDTGGSSGSADPETPGTSGGESADRLTEDEVAPMLQGTLLDSTAFLSPDPEEEGAQNGDELGSLSDGNDALVTTTVVAARLVKGGHAGSNGDGRMEFEDRSAWVARNLSLLPRGGQDVEVEELKELPGVENCLHELLSERARHLTAMETLTGQLRRREAEATKASHDLKALTARLECAEQDRSGLERRLRAAAEEHRVERARWFVHKQVRV